ncbi:MAG: Tim44/TimA family putative adaptor protein [Pseudomonadota bacterium]
MIELLVLIALAAVVLYRLKSVIGTRTGHEGQPDYMREAGDAQATDTGDQGATVTPITQPVDDEEEVEDRSDVPEGSREALDQIRKVEPGFDVHAFAEGARGAYEMILMAYEEGDRQTLQSLLAPDVFQAFEQGIVGREEEGLHVEARFIGVREATLTAVAFEEDTKIADVTVRFVGELITAVRDAENRVVEGDPNEVRRQSDTWTFSREMGSVDPNWLLTGTGG